MNDLSTLEQEIFNKFSQLKNKENLENLRTEVLGKKGSLSKLFQDLATIDKDQKKEFASQLNILKTKVLEEFSKYSARFDQEEIKKKLQGEAIDITLPTPKSPQGKIHPVSQVIDELTCIFAELGFSVAEGPDIENEYNNFTALNTPPNHPARDMHDTFYLDDQKQTLLRTHTSPVQIRTMLNDKPPFKIIAPGRTYRCDSDQTHTPMFHQLEGLYVDKNVTMADLRGCLDYFLKKFFEIDEIKMRFRPSHFPFTEPSAEVDIGYEIKDGKITIGQGDKWLEILGCGMVHPQRLEKCQNRFKQVPGLCVWCWRRPISNVEIWH